MILRKNPFKPNEIEKDPKAFALRYQEILMGVQSIFNNKNILISGSRGIGKSSLAAQFLNLYTPDNTLLERCEIETSFKEYLKAYYSIDQNSSLQNICLDIITQVEFEMKNSVLKKEIAKKMEFEINLGIFKATLAIEENKLEPSSIVNNFIFSIKKIYDALPMYGINGICILIDELDKTTNAINLGHFFKLVHEQKTMKDISNLVFILAGQTGIYARLNNEDRSTERLFAHIPISKLHYEESQHILDHASSKAEPPFIISEAANDAILKMSGGFPYQIHLLADAAFNNMDNIREMTLVDVSNGLRDILHKDKHEKYIANLESMTIPERQIIAICGKFETDKMPAMIPFSIIKNSLGKLYDDWEFVKEVLEALRDKGFIILYSKRSLIQFSDELFRLFLFVRCNKVDESKREDVLDIIANDVDNVSYDDGEVAKIITHFNGSTINTEWDVDRYEELMEHEKEK